MSQAAMTHFNSGAVGGRADYFFAEQERQEEHGIGSGGAEDYYVGAVDDLGGSAWVGNGAQALGLTGQGVNREDFVAVFSGCDPRTGERLRQSSKNGEERAGYEIAFNVDKSISALYAIVDKNAKKQLEQAILQSHDETINYISEKGYFKTRRGKDGVISESTQGIAAARFLHGTSRNQDPHLHVHCEIAAIVENDTGHWSTLDASELYRRQSELRYLFDVKLAGHLKEMGLSISENNSGVTVCGIDEELLGKWSSRRREIIEELEKIGVSGAGNREANLAVTIASRAKKDEALVRDDLFSRWQETAKEYGYDEDFFEEQKALGDELRDTVKSEEVEADLLKNRSVFTELDFDRVTARFTVGRGDFSDFEETRAQLVANLNLVRLTDDFYTTGKMAEAEMAVMRSAIGRNEERLHKLDSGVVEKVLSERFPTLRYEQAQAIRHLTVGSGGVAVMEGAAGTGKSFTLGAVKNLYEQEGFTVHGLAPSGKAADELQSGSSIESQTVHRFLIGLESGRFELSEKDVLVLDEAGMADSVTLARLVDRAHSSGAKLILSGDSNQLEAVGTANLLRDVGKEIGASELIQIARQREPEKRAISQAFFEAQAGAVDAMAAEGLIDQTGQGEGQLRAAVSKYLGNCDGRHFSESLLLADSREQVDRLNDLVRQERIERGELNPYESAKVFLTDENDRAREEYLLAGDRIMFRKNDPSIGVTNGTTGTLVSVSEKNLIVQLDDNEGALIDVDLDTYSRLDVAYAMTVHKSQGMTVDKAVYVTSDRTNNRSAYVAYTRARDGAEFVTSEPIDSLAEQCAQRREKTTVISAYERPDGTNLMLDSLREQAGASRRVADIEASDLPATSHVLAKPYREGTRKDLDGRFGGREVALANHQRESLNHLEDFDAVLAEIRANDEDLANPSEPENEEEQPEADWEAGQVGSEVLEFEEDDGPLDFIDDDERNEPPPPQPEPEGP